MIQFSLFEQPPVVIDDDGMLVHYYPNVIEQNLSFKLFDCILKEAAWHRPVLNFGGKSMLTRRQVAWHADDGFCYRYSGQEHDANPWTPEMLLLKRICEEKTGCEFNSVLLNLYEDGNDHVSFHSDDEEDMSDEVPIVAISLGAKRDFVFKHINGNKHVLELENASMVIMHNGTQSVSKHSIPKRKSVKDPRISLTFRKSIRRK